MFFLVDFVRLPALFCTTEMVSGLKLGENFFLFFYCGVVGFYIFNQKHFIFKKRKIISPLVTQKIFFFNFPSSNKKVFILPEGKFQS
jgi:hypothetical protein